jgi:hypothetical protein
MSTTNPRARVAQRHARPELPGLGAGVSTDSIGGGTAAKVP